ncbi:ATP synthase subunit I [Clostridium aminobutyricum]|uniref:ATP synthase subunit I n=1 Tax=Clostridium aminobutyricum TaxID=33953 RepID=A0A939D7X6_CLOAM|nr:ATP synthase subunit I [Clostridium aminobutyricum]MBN7773074.1 ATP synthase subunit I [Clostridium aminobutyricum]
MNKDTKEMLKKVTGYDIVILIAAALISIMNFKEYTAIVIIAIILSLANFLLNAFLANYMLQAKAKKAFYVLGAAGRVMVTVAIAVLLCRNDTMSYLAFLIGYSLHYMAVILYGVTRVMLRKKGSN